MRVLNDEEIAAKRHSLKGCRLNPIEYSREFCKAQYQADMKWMVGWIKENGFVVDYSEKGDVLIPKMCWESLKQLVEE